MQVPKMRIEGDVQIEVDGDTLVIKGRPLQFPFQTMSVGVSSCPRLAALRSLSEIRLGAGDQ